jgi:hypothetical protein
MLVDAPAFVVTEVARARRPTETAVAVAERDVDAVVAETDDVSPAVAGQVGQEAQVPIDLPITRLDTKSVVGAAGDLHDPVATNVQRHPHPIIAEPDDVTASVRGQVGDNAWMPIGPIEACPTHRSPL